MSAQVAIFVFDGVQILDVAGPAAVFAAANEAAGKSFYNVRVVSLAGGAVQSSCAMQVPTQPLVRVPAGKVDLFLVAGGDERRLQPLAREPALQRWVKRLRPHAVRLASVCTGAFLLAELGMLDGRRAATHWASSAQLSADFPQVQVDGDALFVVDGPVWTSAGVTTGIDMSLAMVERDLGAGVAQRVAETLVLYARRPGHQSQFSPLLGAQARSAAPFAALIEWMANHLHEALDVETLAARSAMSVRSFHRKFTESVGETPAHFVETLRLERVRMLMDGNGSLKEIAAQTGFASAAQLSKAFERRFGIGPRLFRQTRAGA